MPSASGQPVSVEQATDSEFQAWIVASGLSDLVDDDGIAEWSFDDRIRLLNFALRQGYALKFVAESNSNNSENNSDGELFDSDTPASEAV